MDVSVRRLWLSVRASAHGCVCVTMLHKYRDAFLSVFLANIVFPDKASPHVIWCAGAVGIKAA